DRLLADFFGETSDHVERDVGLKQRAAYLAHRGIDVGFGQRPAPRQPIENATKLFRQIVEHLFSFCCLTLRSRRSLRLEGWLFCLTHPSRRRFAAPQDEVLSFNSRHTRRKRGIQYAEASR